MSTVGGWTPEMVEQRDRRLSGALVQMKYANDMVSQMQAECALSLRSSDEPEHHRLLMRLDALTADVESLTADLMDIAYTEFATPEEWARRVEDLLGELRAVNDAVGDYDF